ncbi:hypothetical protein [Jeotgalibacillus malaysiensis]|uniref:hypothetical protein n=1 Tax=Jeotgalibacillus malaysiensis TaxID=1508404 RepID=UPI00384DE4CE
MMKVTNNNQFQKYLSQSHADNINQTAFTQLENLFLDYIHSNNQTEQIRWLCNASMGHGKSTALICLIKHMIEHKINVPLLIAVRELQLAESIFNEISTFKKGFIQKVDTENKNIVEDQLQHYQFIIIQHKRLENLALGIGNPYKYNQYNNKKRMLIIDEKPNFTDSAIFDMGSQNNILEAFDDLSKGIDIGHLDFQLIRHNVMILIGLQLLKNVTSKTTRLIDNEDSVSNRKNLKAIIKQMEESEANKSKAESLRKLKIFKQLLNIDNVGRIDDHSNDQKGKKIIVSNYIDYTKLGLHMLILDGTAKANILQYNNLFELKDIENQNDYSRLTIHIESINTSAYARGKKGNPVQHTIASRVNDLREVDNNLFILPAQKDLSIYKKLIEFTKDELKSYDDKNSESIHLMNTIGKNIIKNKTALYLTSLPKMYPEYYKSIGIALNYDIELGMYEETDEDKWFKSDEMESLYRDTLYAELLQIVHRTKLRQIDSGEEIHIYIAYNEDTKQREGSYTITPISENIIQYMPGANITEHKLTDLNSYNRDKTLAKHIEAIHTKVDEGLELPAAVGKISLSFRKYLNRHWENKGENINKQLMSNGFEIIEKVDNFSDKSKYIMKIG